MPTFDVRCPECDQVFHWDAIGWHDECPSCQATVKCIDNFATPEDQEYYDEYRERVGKKNEAINNDRTEKKWESKPKKYKGLGYYTTDPEVKCTQEGFEDRYICQGCLEEGHVQLPSRDYHDCKMVFVVNGETKGQCCCYSKEHGKRD